MIHLSNKRFRLIVDADRGACVRRFEMRSEDGTWLPILLPSDADSPDASASAMFAMLPFANRARDNVLVIGNRRIQLHPNTEDLHALHGSGWQRAWKVDGQVRERCVLSLAACDPFAFSATQTFTLEEQGLRVTLSLKNQSETAIPVGLGWHPYFPHLGSTRLQFDASLFWLEGPDHLPTEAIAVPPELSFAALAPVPTTWRNNCYQEWRGQAAIHQPDLGYRLDVTASTVLGHLMLYAPQTGVFALEPQSHVSGRTMVTVDGLREVASGRTMDTWLDLSVADLPNDYDD